MRGTTESESKHRRIRLIKWRKTYNRRHQQTRSLWARNGLRSTFAEQESAGLRTLFVRKISGAPAAETFG